MDWRTITVSAEVEVYLNDIKEDVLRMLDTDELVEELRERDVNYDEKRSEKYHMLDKLYASREDIKRHLCDIANCSYHEPIDSLLNKIRYLL